MRLGAKLNVVTSNEGKYKEYKRKFSGYTEVEMLDIGYPEIQTDSLEEVVEFGLEQLEEYKPVLIDDSGLFIDHLQGFPGVYSAYVMDTIGCEGILKLMDNVEDREAEFLCIIGLIDENGDRFIFKGRSRGTITEEQKGEGGFGYDPIFKPYGEERTFAQMSTSEKNSYSHRGEAVNNLINFIEET